MGLRRHLQIFPGRHNVERLGDLVILAAVALLAVALMAIVFPG
jgi:hypothetical protein